MHFFLYHWTPSASTFFAFSFQGRQLTWTRLVQGSVTSPSEYSCKLKIVLDQWTPTNPEVVLLQYVDDLLLCCPARDVCYQHTVSLLNHLASTGNKASKEKLQFCREKVTFLGHCISQGTRHLTTQRIQTLKDFPRPRNARQARDILGLINYCRDWVPNISSTLGPLYEIPSQTPFKLTDDNWSTLQDLIQELSKAPALGLPNYDLPFYLFCYESKGHATGVLTQLHGSRYRPIMYLSTALDPVIRGSPGCVRAVAACAVLLQKVGDIVLDSPLTLFTPHSVQEILNQVQTKHLSAARLTKYEVALLTPTNLTLRRCTTLNPASLLPFNEEEKRGDNGVESNNTQILQTNNTNLSTSNQLFNLEGQHVDDHHDCVSLMELESTTISPVKEAPIPSAKNLFVDGSRYYTPDGKPRIDHSH